MKGTACFRDLVVVERVTDDGVEDEFGNTHPAWEPLEPVSEFWGNMRETPGKERIELGRLEDYATATLRLRETPEAKSITAGDRIVARGQTWAIVGMPIVADPRRRVVEFSLKAGGAVT